MDAFAAVTAAVVLIAPAVTKFTDFVRNLFDSGNRAPKWVWNVVAFGAGVALALIFELDYLPLVELGTGAHVSKVVGEVLTGLAIGGVAAGWHEKFDQLSTSAKGASS